MTVGMLNKSWKNRNLILGQSPILEQVKRIMMRRPVVAFSSLLAFFIFSFSFSGAFAQIITPTAPLKLKSDFLGYSFSVSPRVGYTDNINLLSDETISFLDANDDSFNAGQTFLSNLLTANAIVSHPRFTALFSGDLDFSYLIENDDFVVNQAIGGVGTATIVDNFLYLDIAGSTSRQLVGDNAVVSLTQNAGRQQQANVHSYSASPYVYRQFPNESVAELRYRFSQTFIDQSDIGVFLNDSVSHEALASYESGRLFDRLQFVASAYGNLTDEEGVVPTAPEFSFDQGTLSIEAQYALNSKFALSGAIGYDELNTNVPDDFFDDDALSGIFWRAGFIARPGRKTRLRLEYGERFDDGFINAEARYAVSRRFVFTAGANRTFQTRALANSTQINQLSRRTLDFAENLRQGGESSPREVIQLATQFGTSNLGFNAQTVGVGPTNNAFVGLSGVFGKTTVGLNAVYQNADFGFRTFENVTAAFDINRTLSRRVAVYGNALYRFADTGFSVADCISDPTLFGFFPGTPLFDPNIDCATAASQNGVTHTLGGTVGVNYSLTPRTSAFGQYTRTERFSPVSDLEFSENAVTVGIILDF